MVDSNSKPNNENICLKCSKDELAIDHQAVKVKLMQANQSIEMALEVCNEHQSDQLRIHINCATSYLFEASDKTGKSRKTRV